MAASPSRIVTSNNRKDGVGARLAWLLGPAFLLLAVFMWLNSLTIETPAAPTPEFDESALAISPLRTTLSDPPVVVIAGYKQRCNACHKLFQSSWDGQHELTQHTNISLAHGINNQCDNCHALVPWIWAAIVLNLGTLFLLLTPLASETADLIIVCVALIIGIWAIGLLLYTNIVRITIPVLQGRLTLNTVYYTEPQFRNQESLP